MIIYWGHCDDGSFSLQVNKWPFKNESSSSSPIPRCCGILPDHRQPNLCWSTATEWDTVCQWSTESSCKSDTGDLYAGLCVASYICAWLAQIRNTSYHCGQQENMADWYSWEHSHSHNYGEFRGMEYSAHSLLPLSTYSPLWRHEESKLFTMVYE